jgi:hypothetical protein
MSVNADRSVLNGDVLAVSAQRGPPPVTRFLLRPSGFEGQAARDHLLPGGGNQCRACRQCLCVVAEHESTALALGNEHESTARALGNEHEGTARVVAEWVSLSRVLDAS